MSPRPTPEERLNDLETRFAFLEQHVEDLDRVLVERSAALERLVREVERLRARTPPPDDPPGA